MKRISIQIKPLKQLSPMACSITCLRMLLSYYGVSVSHKEILRFIVKIPPDNASFLMEMARFARSKGFNVDCYVYNLYLTDPKDSQLSKNDLLKKLKHEFDSHNRDKYYDLMLELTIKGIKEGVNYIIKKPNFEIIKSSLVQKIPLSVMVNYAALHDLQGDPFESHDIVLCGLSGQKVFYIDPEHAKRESISVSDLMFAILESKVISASAYLIAIKSE